MKQYLELMRDVVENAERAKSQRDYRAAKTILTKALQSLELAGNPTESDNSEFAPLRNKLKQALASLRTKLALPTTPTSKNPATFILLRCKLKPTNDGKTDPGTRKARRNTNSFLTNFWISKYDLSQSRTFN